MQDKAFYFYKENQLPKLLTIIIFAVCILPFTLNLLGFDFGSSSHPFNPEDLLALAQNEQIDHLYYSLSGSITHTILEWSAFSVAILTVVLSFAHFKIKGDPATPVIGIALLCAGAMDAFHTLAADRLIEAVADNRNLIPFTWAISRLFNALILIIGVSVFLVAPIKKQFRSFHLVLLTSLIFGFIAYQIIHYCATSKILPNTMFPDSIVTRPYDVVPLVLYLFAGIFVFRPFYKRQRDIFTHALYISIFPQVATQLHVAFGSTALFDNHFNIAHFLKIIAYLVPFGGLVLANVQAYYEEKHVVAQLEKTRLKLSEKNLELTKTMEEMERINRFAEGREIRMIELKRKINKLSIKLGLDPPYDVRFAESLTRDGDG